jgi:tripartite-type tricarboxylate transporter receptor subunit TctC
MRARRLGRAGCVALGACLLGWPAAAADDVASFYGSHPITMVVGFNIGGGGDAYARLVARHLGKHIPGNPNVIVRNMQGAGSMTAANHIFNISPKDGSEIGLFAGNLIIDPVIGGVPNKYDAHLFTWIGSPSAETDVCVASRKSGFTRFDQLFSGEMVTGTAGTSAYDFPIALNSVLHTRLKLVKGYAGSAALKLALERGEIDGYCGVGIDSIRSAGMTDETVSILVQFGMHKDPSLPDVPLVFDYAKGKADQQVMTLIFGWTDMARPIAAPPGIPADRAKALRDGFDAAVTDPALLADAAKEALTVGAVSGAEIARFVDEVYRTPKEVAAEAAVMLERKTQ